MKNLNKLSDVELIKLINEETCNDAFCELVSRHENLYYKVCHGYMNGLKRSGVSSEDILSDKMFVFYNSLSSFDADKNVKFSTWLANQARFHCLNRISNTKNKFLNLFIALALLTFQSNYAFNQIQGEYLNENPRLNPANGYGNGSNISWTQPQVGNK